MSLSEKDWSIGYKQFVRPTNIWKAGVRLGLDSVSGFFGSVRLRYDHGGLAFKTDNEEEKDSEIFRIDIGGGYRFSVIDISSNWIYERSINGFYFKNGENSTQSLELKLSYLASKKTIPYVQYTFRDKIYDNQDKLKYNDTIKVGLELIF